MAVMLPWVPKMFFVARFLILNKRFFRCPALPLMGSLCIVLLHLIVQIAMRSDLHIDYPGYIGGCFSFLLFFRLWSLATGCKL